MDELAVRVEAPLQRLLVEQALAYAKESEQAANDAPDGQMLDRCERVALSSGREFLRRSLVGTIEAQAASGEGGRGLSASATVGADGGIRAVRRGRS
jgi:hypothetical protein